MQIHCPFMPLRKDNNGAKFIVSLNQNNSEGFIGAPQLFFSWKVYFLSFKKRPNINLHVKYSWKICNVKSGLTNSLCSRTIYFTIFKEIFDFAIELSSNYFSQRHWLSAARKKLQRRPKKLLCFRTKIKFGRLHRCTINLFFFFLNGK